LLENRYSDDLEAAFHSQLKRAWLIRASLQEFTAAIDHLANCAHIELPKHLISKQAVHAFTNGIREQHIERQLPWVARGH
jgi:FKBP-type peptidyl-prolyl cis-trans isomerase (trigger factor)